MAKQRSIAGVGFEPAITVSDCLTPHGHRYRPCSVTALYRFFLRGSSVTTVTRLRAGLPGFDSVQGHGFLLFATAPIPTPGPTSFLIHWIPGLKRPGRKSKHSSPSRAEVKNAWNYTSASQYVFMVWCLI
jgi:hypothetical protein